MKYSQPKNGPQVADELVIPGDPRKFEAILFVLDGATRPHKGLAFRVAVALRLGKPGGHLELASVAQYQQADRITIPLVQLAPVFVLPRIANADALGELLGRIGLAFHTDDPVTNLQIGGPERTLPVYPGDAARALDGIVATVVVSIRVSPAPRAAGAARQAEKNRRTAAIVGRTER